MRSRYIEMAQRAKEHITESNAPKEANEGPWLVWGIVGGKTVERECSDWEKAKSALRFMEGRGGRFVRYSRIKGGRA